MVRPVAKDPHRRPQVRRPARSSQPCTTPRSGPRPYWTSIPGDRL